MRIFVTGGAGFIGSHVVDLLLKEGHTVTVFDNMNSSVRNETEGVTTITGDIRDFEKLDHSLQGHDVIIAMAAAHLRVSLSDPIFVHDINATGTLQTLRAAKKNTIQRFIYISSSEAYGTAHDKIMDEQHDIQPTTVYGVSKYVGELYTNQFAKYEGLKTTVIRPFNTYGPRSHFNGFYGEVIPRMAIRVMNNLPPIIFGDGSNTRDFTYVTDTAWGIVKAINTKDAVGETINIAFGKEVSIKSIAEIICKQGNDQIQPIYEKARPQDVLRHAANTTKAKRILSWNPKISIEEGIKLYIEWVKKTYTNLPDLLQEIPKTNW